MNAARPFADAPGPAPVELRERPVQLRGSRLARAALRLLGWTLVNDGLPARQGVMVAYPHTSNWDFPIGVLAKWAVGIEATWWAKESLFRVPLMGPWMRWLGGRPIVRGRPQGAVVQMIETMREARAADAFCWLALAPEGTRSRTEGWRTGFWRIAVEARVPVALVMLDFGRRRVGFDSFWRMSGDLDADFAALAARLADCRGRRPELASPIVPIHTPPNLPQR